MTEDELMVAALAAPDALPMTPEQLKNAKRRPRVAVIRRALGLTQEQFSTCYGISLGIIRG
jgi:putative transcriptional regulator